MVNVQSAPRGLTYLEQSCSKFLQNVRQLFTNTHDVIIILRNSSMEKNIDNTFGGGVLCVRFRCVLLHISC